MTELLAERAFPEHQTHVKVGNVTFGGDDATPIIIAGPCAVESEYQLLTTAATVAEVGADMLRGGAYKPRTSPYSFRGMGEPGLLLLALARERTGLPVVTEAMAVADLPAIVTYVDMIQIGARNMQNYPLLEAAARTGLPILLKRGFAASVDDWLYAAEYILAQGNPHVVLCERGIRTFETETRFTLDIGGMAAAQLRTHLPIIADPSHAAGRHDLVAALAHGALAAGAQGLIVEVHNDPQHALSDREQALSLAEFVTMMNDMRHLRGSVRRLIPHMPRFAAIRGATRAENTVASITTETVALIRAIMDTNGLQPNHLVSAFFTVSTDLNAAFPARAMRALGYGHVAAMCAQEISVPNSMSGCIRVMVHVQNPPYLMTTPVYLRGTLENITADPIEEVYVCP